MKVFCFGVMLLAFCLVCDVLSDYSDSILPTKEMRNRVQRTMRVNMRVGKRYGDDEEDFKRSAPQFLLNPRVGKNDKTWKLQKRNEPKANDLWFGPRIGRSNEDILENLPWAYVVLNGNRATELRSNGIDPIRDENTD